MMKFLVCDLSLIDRQNLIGDRFIDYSNSKDYFWNDKLYHKPISWHSYSSAMNGRFVSAPLDNWQEHINWADCILFTFCYNLKMAKQVIDFAKKNNKKIIGAFHENGSTMDLLIKNNFEWLVDLKNLANSCDGLLTYPRNVIHKDIYKSLGVPKEKLLYFPQPYYLDIRNRFLKDEKDKKGIFIGCRFKEQEHERRNFIYNVCNAINKVNDKEVGNRIVIQNEKTTLTNDQLLKYLKEINPNIDYEIYGLMEYEKYLDVISTCELTINMDSSDTQGQVDYDSLFVGTPIDINKYYRTDCADLFKEFLENHDITFQMNNTKQEIINKFLKDYCSFDKTKKQINDWYNKMK